MQTSEFFFIILGSSSDSESSAHSDSDNDAKPQPSVKNKPVKIKSALKSTNKKAGKQLQRIELTANEIAKLMVQAVDNG